MYDTYKKKLKSWDSHILNIVPTVRGIPGESLLTRTLSNLDKSYNGQDLEDQRAATAYRSDTTCKHGASSYNGNIDHFRRW